ncbi:MAG: zinc ribbon domain-containing protein [Deltaproteobacteria bacterium]|nr:zinc ribbon domain-containing protein [Deltaproteobacteria bacterium]
MSEKSNKGNYKCTKCNHIGNAYMLISDGMTGPFCPECDSPVEKIGGVEKESKLLPRMPQEVADRITFHWEALKDNQQ